MKYKVGDVVRVRQQKAIERINQNRAIPFGYRMIAYCGKKMTICEVSAWGTYYHCKEDGGDWAWTDEMFEGYAFDYGQRIEVSDSEIDWEEPPRIYIGYIDGALYPYITVGVNSEEHFKNGEIFGVTGWRFARPIRKEPENRIKSILKSYKEDLINEEDVMTLICGKRKGV